MKGASMHKQAKIILVIFVALIIVTVILRHKLQPGHKHIIIKNIC